MARPATWNRPFGLVTTLLFALALSHLQQSALCAFQAPTEALGYQASLHLMRQLANCLLDAAQLYLSHDSIQPLMVGSSALTDGKAPLSLPVSLSEMLSPAESKLDLEDAWTEPMRQLRNELRGLLESTLGDRPDLAKLLDFFQILAAKVAYLKRPPQGADMRSQLINFVAEAVGVLGELHGPGSANIDPDQSEDQRQAAAVDTIKRNYAYLMQIVAAYNLVFNQTGPNLVASLEGAAEDASKLDIASASKRVVELFT